MEKISKLKVERVVQETHDAITVFFKQPLFWKLKYSAGQYLTALVEIGGQMERRCFSLNSAPGIEEELSITVKRLNDGDVSSQLFETVKVGNRIKVLHPQGEFTVTPDPENKRHILLFGGGSGIAPLMSILKTVLNLEPKSIVSLFYGNRDEESIIYNEELKDLKFDFKDRLNLVHILEDPGTKQSYRKGRVERGQVPELLKLVPKFPFGHTYCYICGPSGMMIEAEAGLLMSGVPRSNIFIERYSQQVSIHEVRAKGALVQNRDIRLIHGGATNMITVKANRSILNAALDEGLDLPYVCKDGICGGCKAVCESGEVYMPKDHVLDESEVAQNMILSCVSYPVTNNVVVRILDDPK
ncbi:ring-1,2-phenylacetyl-CoA epoxidase subunit PaaE [Reichenbachiella agariperforans]|uniref:Ring-1,2-phenylacetyl-CoA epoxidase subunit PaaE n=1 Tax=Reichenbachiella agariperforans TaxID=156994 RepID=A0A1M6KIY6_REIAG|nr:ferredoxin--NADP reductase [Reichenbachiella agariperforans]SHJ58811.1 ring-1,2-phenylacetyl-CoA epoxidase subunit PaaE [Reichenbachiella agariperforans]